MGRGHRAKKNGGQAFANVTSNKSSVSLSSAHTVFVDFVVAKQQSSTPFSTSRAVAACVFSYAASIASPDIRLAIFQACISCIADKLGRAVTRGLIGSHKQLEIWNAFATEVSIRLRLARLCLDPTSKIMSVTFDCVGKHLRVLVQISANPFEIGWGGLRCEPCTSMRTPWLSPTNALAAGKFRTGRVQGLSRASEQPIWFSGPVAAIAHQQHNFDEHDLNFQAFAVIVPAVTTDRSLSA